MTAAMMTWPFILGDEAIPGTVSGELGGDPASVLLVLLFTVGVIAWCLSIVMPMIIGGFKVTLWLSAPYLGAVFVFPLAGVRIFENPASSVSILTRAAVALSGLVVVTILAALRNVIDKPTPQPRPPHPARR